MFKKNTPTHQQNSNLRAKAKVHLPSLILFFFKIIDKSIKKKKTFSGKSWKNFFFHEFTLIQCFLYQPKKQL